LAPIALFVYNRLEHTERTVTSLQANDLAPKSDLLIFSDGAKNQVAAATVQQVRRYIWGIGGFRSVSIVERERNLGLANSIIAGVTQVVSQHGRVIVLEDDLVTSPHFLRYMNDALTYYCNDERVISIHAYSPPVSEALPETFFLRGADCWGWGTWARGWSLFESDGDILLSELRKRGLGRLFDFNHSYLYMKMLEDQIAGENDSWAIRWYASAFLRDKLTLYPGISLVSNIGNEGSGFHGSRDKSFDVTVANRMVSVGRTEVMHSEVAFRAFANFFASLPRVRMRQIVRKAIRFLRVVSGEIG
jgi:glycosyl transferase family 2